MALRRPALPTEFTVAYRTHADFVWRILARFGVTEDQLEDALQEVFIVAHRHWGAWEDRASMRPWLYGVARRVASTHHRTESRRWRKQEALPTPAPAPSLEDRLEDRARLHALARAVTSLAPDQRAVFTLADIEELSAPQIAEALGCKLNTVYSRLRRARAAIARAMAEHELDPAPSQHHPRQEQRHGRAQ